MTKPASTVSVPDPRPVLFLVAMALILVWAMGDAAWASFLLPGILLTIVLVYWLALRPDAAVIALIAAAAMPRFSVPISNLNARPEHIIGGLLCLAVPFWMLRRRQSPQWIFADYLVIAYLACNLFSSLFMSAAPAQTIKWAMQQALAILPYFLLRILLTDQSSFRWAIRLALAVGALEAAYGTICFFSNVFFQTTFGVTPDQYQNIPGTYGTQYEANILGAFCGAICVMMLAMYLEKRSRMFLLGYAVALAGMAVSFSRAALAATVIGLGLLLVRGFGRGLMDKNILLKVGIATVCVAMALSPVLLKPYVERYSLFSPSDITADENTAVRGVQTALALEGVRNHPVLGNGTSSFQLAFDWQDVGMDWESLGWISNTELRVLHDTGAVGLGMFLFFLLSLAVRSWRILKREANPELVALLFSAVVYCITFQFTEGTLLAFAWVHLGLIACATSLYQDHSEENDGNSSSSPRQGVGDLRETMNPRCS